MITLLTILHVVVCLFLIIVVLLQSGKAADLAGAFGGMGSQTAFGPRGAATVLSKATTTAAVLFMLTSITLGIMQGNRGGAGAESVIQKTGLDGEAAETPGAIPGAPVQDLNLTPPQVSIDSEAIEDAGGSVEIEPIQTPPQE